MRLPNTFMISSRSVSFVVIPDQYAVYMTREVNSQTVLSNCYWKCSASRMFARQASHNQMQSVNECIKLLAMCYKPQYTLEQIENTNLKSYNHIYTFLFFQGNMCKFTQIMSKFHKSWSTEKPCRPVYTNSKSLLHFLFHPCYFPLNLSHLTRMNVSFLSVRYTFYNTYTTYYKMYKTVVSIIKN